MGKLKRLIGAAEVSGEDVMTVPAHHLIAGVAGDRFGRAVEKCDVTIHVVGDDALREAVQDQVRLVVGPGQCLQVSPGEQVIN